jgi:hypothetical protein
MLRIYWLRMRCCKLPAHLHYHNIYKGERIVAKLPSNHPERSEEQGEPRNELQGNQPPPTSTEALRRLQQMVQDLGAKYDVLSKTVAEKQGGKEPLANIFQNVDSMFTDEVANSAFLKKFKILDIAIFTSNEDLMEHLMTFGLIHLYTRPLTQ